MRRMLPRRIAALIDRAGVSAATLHFALVTPAAVRACHARGAAVWMSATGKARPSSTVFSVVTRAMRTTAPLWRSLKGLLVN